METRKGTGVDIFPVSSVGQSCLARVFHFASIFQQTSTFATAVVAGAANGS